MASPRSWFDQGPMRGRYERGSTITTDDGTEWEILERLKQDDFQAEKLNPSPPSYAILKLSCIKANVNPNERLTSEAFARVYVQVPYIGTEFDDPDSRALQADPTFQPDELDAYRKLSKHPVVSTFTPKLLGSKNSVHKPSGFVPGGFLILVVWERVPGLPLGDGTGKATGFWDLHLHERRKIRETFEKTFKEISSTVGIWPQPISPRHLVWNNLNDTLFWVGFRKVSMKKDKPWTMLWLPAWGLVKTPTKVWTQLDWDGDTTGWVY